MLLKDELLTFLERQGHGIPHRATGEIPVWSNRVGVKGSEVQSLYWGFWGKGKIGKDKPYRIGYFE